jgi:Carboxypeptidase regulatory-like domain/TonB dependent receptor
MSRRVFRLAFICSLACLTATLAYAQGATTASVSGVVVDSAGGVVPGATVSVKNKATGTTSETVTNTNGVFSIPALEAGTYTVTVSLQGFKTAVINDVPLLPGQTPALRATLEVGNLEETIVVASSSELVNTQTATISSTLNADQINKLPMPTRNAINAVTFLPGVNTAGVNRDSNFNGLPDSFVAISLDGVNNNENFNKSTEGLFAMVTPRQDAVEAVTVTTAVGDASIGGHGAVQISFVTRSGTNRFIGSGYESFRHPDLNTNYWFNKDNGLPKNDVKLNQYGFRQGGPIVIPKLYNGRGKAFFFVNYEELRLPNTFTRTRTVLTPEAQRGIFRWERANGTIGEVDMLALAARNNHLNALDPLTIKLLNQIRAATTTTGVINVTENMNTVSYVWQSPGNQIEKQPVVRLDYNLTDKHRVSGTYNWQVVDRNPDQLNGGDVRFPGFTNYSHYISYRPLTSATLRSALTSNLVNELRGGIRWGPGYFGQNHSNGPETFAEAEGFAMTLGNFDVDDDLTNWHTQNGPSWRSAWSWNIDNTLNWQKGKHSMSFGGSLYFGNVWLKDQQMVPSLTFNVATGDPARSMFSTANFPGASGDQLADARDIFGLLTGRVVSYGSQAVLDEANAYQLLGTRKRAGRMNEYSMFAQDSWRVTPALTINGGVRWDVQMPFTPVNDVMSQSTFDDACGISGIGADGRCRFFDPTASGGKVPTFVEFNRNTPGYNTDWNNVAPNIGVAWRPNVQSGWLRSILGDPDQATVRAGYSIAYDRQGMAVFTGQYGANPGSQLSLTRNEDNGLMVPAGQTWPVLLTQRDRLGSPQPCPPGVVNAGCIPDSPTYPIPVRSGRADSINIFHPDIKIAFARSWTVSFQRAITPNMAVDVRYVGTRGVNQWTEEEYNERNWIENGFLDEFRRAMGNLQAHVAAGCGQPSAPDCSFAYRGPGTGTQALPIYLAYFNAQPASRANDPAAYTGGNWTNDDFLDRFARSNPNPSGSAGDLDGNNGRRNNAIAAGLPRNFFLVNPDVANVGVFVSQAYSDYHALQVELRRRLSRGFQINGSYQYALEGGSAFLGQRYGRVMNDTANVRHAFKAQWNYTIPVGQGQRFGANMNKWLNGILGGWEFDGAGRVQARTLNFGNVRLVGMTPKDLQEMYHFRLIPDPDNPGQQLVTMLPEDVILNTRRAYNVSATSPTGYSDLGVPEGRYFAPANTENCIQLKSGDCAPRTLLIRAPFFTRFDIGVSKRFPIKNQVNFELRVDVLNVFDNINFNPVSNPGSGATILQATSAYTDASNTFDPGGRLGQLVFRLNW